MSGIFTQLLVLSEEVQKGGGVEVEVESWMEGLQNQI
jgi:hypothetical protein